MNNLNLLKPNLVNNRQNIQNCYWLGQKHHAGFLVCSECSDYSPWLARLSENLTKGESHE